MILHSNTCVYYDYAGGTYYSVKLCWFFDAPEDIEGLVWTNGDKIRWHLHGSNNADGEFLEHTAYLEEIHSTQNLRNYFHQQRYWMNKYNGCATKQERIDCLKSYREATSPPQS